MTTINDTLKLFKIAVDRKAKSRNRCSQEKKNERKERLSLKFLFIFTFDLISSALVLRGWL